MSKLIVDCPHCQEKVCVTVGVETLEVEKLQEHSVQTNQEPVTEEISN